MSLKVTKYGETLIHIEDEDGEDIYKGAPDVDCVIEALAFHFGEEVETEEKDELEGSDPTHSYDDEDVEQESEESSESNETDDEEVEEIEVFTLSPQSLDGEDWPDDDEDESD